jgi:hypothetical protein
MPEGADQNINWETPSGRLIRKFVATLPKDRPIVLNIFGSTGYDVPDERNSLRELNKP